MIKSEITTLMVVINHRCSTVSQLWCHRELIVDIVLQTCWHLTIVLHSFIVDTHCWLIFLGNQTWWRLSWRNWNGVRMVSMASYRSAGISNCICTDIEEINCLCINLPSRLFCIHNLVICHLDILYILTNAVDRLRIVFVKLLSFNHWRGMRYIIQIAQLSSRNICRWS